VQKVGGAGSSEIHLDHYNNKIRRPAEKGRSLIPIWKIEPNKALTKKKKKKKKKKRKKEKKKKKKKKKKTQKTNNKKSVWRRRQGPPSLSPFLGIRRGGGGKLRGGFQRNSKIDRIRENYLINPTICFWGKTGMEKRRKGSEGILSCTNSGKEGLEREESQLGVSARKAHRIESFGKGGDRIRNGGRGLYQQLFQGETFFGGSGKKGWKVDTASSGPPGVRGISHDRGWQLVERKRIKGKGGIHLPRK